MIIAVDQDAQPGVVRVMHVPGCQNTTLIIVISPATADLFLQPSGIRQDDERRSIRLPLRQRRTLRRTRSAPNTGEQPARERTRWRAPPAGSFRRGDGKWMIGYLNSPRSVVLAMNGQAWKGIRRIGLAPEIAHLLRREFDGYGATREVEVEVIRPPDRVEEVDPIRYVTEVVVIGN